MKFLLILVALVFSSMSYASPEEVPRHFDETVLCDQSNQTVEMQVSVSDYYVYDIVTLVGVSILSTSEDLPVTPEKLKIQGNGYIKILKPLPDKLNHSGNLEHDKLLRR